LSFRHNECRIHARCQLDARPGEASRKRVAESVADHLLALDSRRRMVAGAHAAPRTGSAGLREKKLQTLAAPPASSLTPTGPQRIALTEEELNSYLTAHLALQGGAPGAEPGVEQAKSSVRDVKVTLEGDRARVFAVFNLAGKDLTLELEGRLRVAGGYLRFEPTGGKLGDLSLPQSALAALFSRLLDTPENRESFRMPPEIRDIRVENGELVIERQ
jgi:hypothetical protein